MDIEITAFYCISDGLLKSLNYQDHFQCQMSTAEVMTAALTARPFLAETMRKADSVGGLPEFLNLSGAVWRTGLPPPLIGQIH